MPAERPLNPNQLKFVERFKATGDATQSYIDAYGRMDRATAAAGGSRLLRNVKVNALIEAVTAKAVQTAELTAEYVIARLKTEAEFYGDGAQHSARIKALEHLAHIVKVLGGDEKPKGEDRQGAAIEELARLAARLAARQPHPGGAGETPLPPPLAPEPGSAGPGVPE